MPPIEGELRTSSDGMRWDRRVPIFCRPGESRDFSIKGGMLRVVVPKDGEGRLTLIKSGKMNGKSRIVHRRSDGQFISDGDVAPGEIKEPLARESSVEIVGPYFKLELRHS